VDKPGTIGIDVFNRIILSIAKSYRKARQELPVLCPWFYSEPMMTPNLDEYLTMATDMGYRINLTTNGTIDQWDKLAIPDIDYHIVVFSIDGNTEQTYRAIRNHDLESVIENLDHLCELSRTRDLKVPICVKLTNKGIEWAEIVDFVRHHLSNPMVKMVAVSKAFNDDDGLPVTRHECRYLSEYFIIQHDLTIAPCCMRWSAIEQGMGKVDVDNTMGSYNSLIRTHMQVMLQHDAQIGPCERCQSAYTGDMINGTVDGEPFGKAGVIRTRQDFYNTFYFNDGEAK